MPACTLSRPLLLSFVLALAAPAIAQSDKDPQATPKQGSAKSSAIRPAAAAKRLDVVPSSSVKPTTTRPATPAQTPAPPPAQHDWHCDSESADA